MNGEVQLPRRSLSLFVKSLALTVAAGVLLTAIACGRLVRARAAGASIVPATADLHAGDVGGR
jgi:hypothetical protein